MITESIISELESIVNTSLENAPIPYAKGNSIRIKHIVVRHNINKGYLVYDTKTNSQIARTHFKSSALAIAKNLAQHNDVTSKLLFLDKELLKHYNDVVFFKNIIKKSKDLLLTEVREIRLEISMEKTKVVREKIDNFIF